MVFVTVGSQKFPFDRLLRAVDECVANGVIQEEVFAQTGACEYTPENYRYVTFINRGEFASYMEAADVVLTHGGTGVIVNALKSGKHVIAMARLSCFGEHVDDHQIQLLEEFEKAGLILTCNNASTLAEAYREAINCPSVIYRSNNSAFVADLDSYLRRAY